MAKSKPKKPPSAPPAPDSARTPVPPIPALQSVIALVVDSVSAKGRRCPIGTIISPNIDDWPEHRVAAHVRDGRAAKVPVDGA